MELRSTAQSDANAIRARITSALETGNQGQARTLLRELADVNTELAGSIRLDVLAEYGVSL